MQITQLYIYPVKSLGGKRLEESDVSDRGLALDRRWLLVDHENVFITQRKYPELSRFQPSIQEGKLTITDKQSGRSVTLPEIGSGVEREPVRVWDDIFPAVEVQREVSDWFSELLKMPVRLMYQPDESHRKVNKKYAVSGDEIVSAADGYPVLMISESSLEELNDRMELKVEMSRFRPNIVISGIAAHEEDQLGEVAIGTAVLKGVKPCGRCLMVDRDAETGQVSGEVLKTLSAYRKAGNSVNFGQNLLVIKEGKIKVGDEVFTL